MTVILIVCAPLVFIAFLLTITAIAIKKSSRKRLVLPKSSEHKCGLSRLAERATREQ